MYGTTLKRGYVYVGLTVSKALIYNQLTLPASQIIKTHGCKNNLSLFLSLLINTVIQYNFFPDHLNKRTTSRLGPLLSSSKVFPIDVMLKD